jgi:hypothetical protein
MENPVTPEYERERLIDIMPQLTPQCLRWLRQGGVLAFASFLSLFITIEGKAFGYGANMPYELQCSAPSEGVVVNDVSMKPECVFDISNRSSDSGGHYGERCDLDLRAWFIGCQNVARQMNHDARCSLVWKLGSNNRSESNCLDNRWGPTIVFEVKGEMDSELLAVFNMMGNGIDYANNVMPADFREKICPLGIDDGLSIEHCSIGSFFGWTQAFADEPHLSIKNTGLQKPDENEPQSKNRHGVLPPSYFLFVAGAALAGLCAGLGLCWRAGVWR